MAKVDLKKENQVEDISPLSDLVKLWILLLYDNQISDISPLVSNPGIGNGDDIDIRRNPLNTLSCTVYIPELESRGARVFHSCP